MLIWKMRCDMCGVEQQLFLTDIEGAKMNVCKSCSAHGKVISRVVSKEESEIQKSNIASVPKRSEIITIINKNYPSMIKTGREKRGLKQDEFAKKLGEKSSIIHQLETGHLSPDMTLARKLEKFLGIKIIEEYEEKSQNYGKKDSSIMTIGDLINIK